MATTVEIFTFNQFQENTYLIFDEHKNGIIIDPGCYERHEKDELRTFIESEKIEIKALLNTHCHIDHVLGNSFVLEHFTKEFLMHELDLPTLASITNYAELYGFSAYEESPKPTKFVKHGDVLKFGEIELNVIFGPGHAPGHVAFHNVKENYLIGGDILFKGSFGRVDLPGGNMDVLKKTIFNEIFTLPENTIVYPGHGDSTTIKQEKVSNYILQF
jgi:glyoxylase-like metal-dependent hydrolase (beta-lactamase superfamily II)